MPSLDGFGKLAPATIVFYIPIFIITLILVLRHGFRRDAGWIFLLIFSIIRILGGILLIAAQLTRPVNTNLYIAAYILESAGLSPLLLATLGFLRSIGKNSFSEGGPMTRVFRLLGLLATIALILTIYGGTTSGSSNSADLSTGTTLRHVGSILFAILYVLLAAIHVLCWQRVHTLLRHRRTLLTGISFALPFLGVRMLYSVLSSFSGSLVPSATSTPNNNSLSKFNIVAGDWRINLVMGLIMEFVVVVIYTTVGAKTPLQNDYLPNASGPVEEHSLNANEEHSLDANQGQKMYFQQAQAGYGNTSQGHMGYMA